MAGYDYDWLVIGSGFGGSVAALRLAEKGYRVAVLESGRRFTDDDFAETTWQLGRYYWMPKLGLKGILSLSQRAFGYRNLFVCDGAAVPANVGANPSRTITAMAERALAQVPPKPGAPESILEVTHAH